MYVLHKIIVMNGLSSYGPNLHVGFEMLTSLFVTCSLAVTCSNQYLYVLVLVCPMRLVVVSCHVLEFSPDWSVFVIISDI